MRQKHNNPLFIQKEMYKTLSYSDIFDYPLTGDQLFLFLGIHIQSKQFFQAIKTLPHRIVKNTIYYFLPKRESIVLERIEKEKYAIEKMQKAQQIARILSYLPTICFIGVSGSLAMRNADKKSDSDLFFITKSHTVWITRFFVYLILLTLGVKRKKRNSSNAICANMFVDENTLRFSLKKRNDYVAHEIVQIVPLVNKKNTYKRFLLANTWVKNFFPNFAFPKKISITKKFSFSFLLFPFEYISRIMQLWYMKSKTTCETLTPTLIAFHPIDYEKIILQEYDRRLRKITNLFFERAERVEKLAETSSRQARTIY